MVRCTLSTEFWMPRELSRTIFELDVGRQGLLQLGHRGRTAARHLDGVGALRLDDVEGDGALAVSGRRRFSSSCWPSTTVGDLAQVDRSQAAAGPRSGRRSCRLGRRPGHLDDAVVVAARHVPAGNSGSRRARPPAMSLTPTSSACMRSGSSSMLIWRLTPPAIGDLADVAHGLHALDDNWSVSVVSSRTARCRSGSPPRRIGWSSGLKRWISGSLISGRKAARTCWTLLADVLVAMADGTVSSNSAMTIERPSSEREVSVLMPAMALTLPSILRLISLSTVSGEAPG
jgi:hypothetical protein